MCSRGRHAAQFTCACSHFGTGSVQVLPPTCVYRPRVFFAMDLDVAPYLPCIYDTYDMYIEPSSASSSSSRAASHIALSWTSLCAPAPDHVPPPARLLAPVAAAVPRPRQRLLVRWFRGPNPRDAELRLPAAHAMTRSLVWERRQRRLEWLASRPEPWYR